MYKLNIQIQKKWNDPVLKRVLSILLSETNIRNISISRGYDIGPYINFNIECRSGRSLWKKLEGKLNKIPNFKNSSIVVTTGKNGWDDYQIIQSCY